MPARQFIPVRRQRIVSEGDDSSPAAHVSPSSSSLSSPSHRASPPSITPVEAQSSETSLTVQPWSPALEAVLEKPASSLPKWFAFCGCAFAVILGTWAWVGRFDEVVHAQGKLVPQGETHKVHPIESGKLISLHVKEGQRVQKGESLVVLADDAAKGEADRLQHSILLKQQQLVQHQMLLDTARREGHTRRLIAEADQQTQQVERQKAELEVRTLQGVLERDRQGLKQYEERMQRLVPLVEVGAIAKERLFQSEQEIHQQQTELFRTEASLSQAKAGLQQLQAIELQKEQEAQNIELETEQQLNELAQRTLQLQEQLNDAESQLQQVHRQLQDYELQAPISGIVASLNVHNPGELIQAGQTLLEIRQKDDPLVLEAAVASRDAGFIEPGTLAKLRFDAYPYQKFGVIPGEVIFTSPDSYSDPQLGTVYRLQIKTQRDYVLADSENVQLQAGQTAMADIVVRRRRIADLLLDPLRKLRANTLETEIE